MNANLGDLYVLNPADNRAVDRAILLLLLLKNSDMQNELLISLGTVLKYQSAEANRLAWEAAGHVYSYPERARIWAESGLSTPYSKSKP